MTDEQAEILGWFCHMLQAASGDGGKKRAAGLKPVWKVDPSHEAAIYSHLMKWKKGEKVDADSGAHPLVHLAWRALAIAWQETQGALAQRMSPYPADDEIRETLDIMAKRQSGREIM